MLYNGIDEVLFQLLKSKGPRFNCHGLKPVAIDALAVPRVAGDSENT
jgi:hypothetical protein